MTDRIAWTMDEHVDMDYGGPFTIKESCHRNTWISKVFLVLFTCMSVKALYLEIVSDLSTDAFLSVQDRFVDTRSFLLRQWNKLRWGRSLTQNTILWNSDTRSDDILSPMYALHFGGLWETAIKYSKFYLEHVIEGQVLTFEVWYTPITRIEGILNSRLLTRASTDPHDLCALTSGHFLIGQAFHALPEHNITTILLNRLGRW